MGTIGAMFDREMVVIIGHPDLEEPDMSEPLSATPASASEALDDRGYSNPLHVVDRRYARFDEEVRAAAAIPLRSVAVVGLGYVGLPTALGLHESGLTVQGLDVSGARIGAIYAEDVDLVPDDRDRLARALNSDRFDASTDPATLQAADAVIICVPTPLDHHLSPELGPVRGACRAVVEQARRGQTIVLTSTSYVGTTRDLLVEPLRQRGF